MTRPPRTYSVFEYAVLRAVPRIDRGECVNVGVVLYCQDADFLQVGVHVDAGRLRMLDPGVDVAAVEESLDALRLTCDGDGPAGRDSLGVRFRWLTAPRSTVVRPDRAHSGLTQDPAAELTRLVTALVR